MSKPAAITSKGLTQPKDNERLRQAYQELMIASENLNYHRENFHRAEKAYRNACQKYDDLQRQISYYEYTVWNDDDN